MNIVCSAFRPSFFLHLFQPPADTPPKTDMARVTSSYTIIKASDILEGYKFETSKSPQLRMYLFSTISCMLQRYLHKVRQVWYWYWHVSYEIHLHSYLMKYQPSWVIFNSENCNFFNNLILPVNRHASCNNLLFENKLLLLLLLSLITLTISCLHSSTIY